MARPGGPGHAGERRPAGAPPRGKTTTPAAQRGRVDRLRAGRAAGLGRRHPTDRAWTGSRCRFRSTRPRHARLRPRGPRRPAAGGAARPAQRRPARPAPTARSRRLVRGPRRPAGPAVPRTTASSSAWSPTAAGGPGLGAARRRHHHGRLRRDHLARASRAGRRPRVPVPAGTPPVLRVRGASGCPPAAREPATTRRRSPSRSASRSARPSNCSWTPSAAPTCDARDTRPAGLAAVTADEVYRGAVAVMMRIVFLLFAEERGLLPADSELYARAYSVGRPRRRTGAAGGRRAGEEASWSTPTPPGTGCSPCSTPSTGAWTTRPAAPARLRRLDLRPRRPPLAGGRRPPRLLPWTTGPCCTCSRGADRQHRRGAAHARRSARWTSSRSATSTRACCPSTRRADDMVVGLIGKDGHEDEVAARGPGRARREQSGDRRALPPARRDVQGLRHRPRGRWRSGSRPLAADRAAAGPRPAAR